ncbi:hypothetical protein [Parasitella parasitica]|uniref:Uncharacterized protein n=1 Tax=Parasitella parasitica TaxID=35722 RepID=A0A0B7MXJ3_9FUNG|nr:hypothetical protein [Parasitella parasitica]
MRSKKRQHSIYEPGSARINDPATIQDASKYSRKRKKNRTIDKKEQQWNALRTAFRNRLISLIRTCHRQCKPFSELYTTLLTGKRLPKGIVKEAEASINAAEGTITTLLSVNLTKVKKPSVEYWRDYIAENFEDVKQSVVGEGSSSKTPAQIDGNGSNSDDGDDSSSGFNSDDDVQEDTEEYRACSTSLSSIIRKDLSNEVRVAVLNAIKNTLE